ncbi:hypothetical protein QBC35DRAFT_383944 [Podospora australis]|uniref:rRNA adenine N(6)-methyltransferase n=1 Tax=Podospora australis TaxID=1536484 RepID=A0AAN6WTG6_9PEZI|nr:hypothetical protein QBC35DRAFT_383944 [Podospora australis]
MGVKTIGKRGATSSYLRAYDPVAEKLAESGIFTGVARKKRGVTVDNTRINITSEALCDDVLTYIKSTLSPRHDGCDIVDLFPGVGVFSRKLNDLLKPRSHLLLEPDEDFYTPFLQPLLDRPGTKLLQKSGIIWEDLEEVLSPEHLPHQVKRKYRLDETPERNDTLLVVVNLSMWPKRRFRTFHNVAALVLYQFMTSMRTAALFQQYGRVRMLIWVEESDKLPLLPRTLQRRRRLSVDVDLNTEWICEVAGPDKADAALTSSSEGWFRRDHNIDLKSMELALARMKEAGITTIPGRETADLKEYLEKVANGEYDPKGSMMGMTKRASKTAVWAEKIYEAWDRGEIEKGTALHKTLKTMRHLDSSNTKNLIKCMDQIDMRLQIEQKLIEAEAKNDALALEVARELEAEWEAYMKEHFAKEKLRADFLLHRDNLIAIQSDPPLLAWDRRYAEPLRVKPEEFFPNVPCSLIDIQPAALDSILREKGPDTNRGGDMFELIAPSLIQAPTSPIEKVLEAAYVGAGTGVIPYCKSLTDPKQGGTPLKGPFGKLTPRLLNAAQLVDIAKAWSNWPFKPTWEDLVVRHTESDVEVRESDILRGNSGGSADDDL